VKDTLKLLGEAINETVALELQKSTTESAALGELGVTLPRSKILAGMNVLENAGRDLSLNEDVLSLINKWMAYDKYAGNLRKKLAACGIEPIAILPNRAWDRICERGKLLRFIPQDEGTQFSAPSVRSESYAHAWRRLKLQENLASGAATLLFFAAIFVAVLFGDKLGWWQTGAIIVILLLLAWFLGKALMPDGINQRWWEEKYLQQAIAKHEKNGTVYERLDYGEPYYDFTFNVSIPLPPTPASEEDWLLKAKQLNIPLRVAMADEAVACFLKGQAATWEEVKNLKSPKCDPVAYVYEDSVVAVIARFGDFPIEQKVVQGIINSLYSTRY